jgi:hypothetical protein
MAQEHVQVVLEDYWYESIPREEAFSRLRTRDLRPTLASEIEADIPDKTEHFLSFHGDAFREYAKFSDEEHAWLMLFLPLVHEDHHWKVVVPLHPARRGAGSEEPGRFGIDIHDFHAEGGQLFENGEPRDSFELILGPTVLTVNASFVDPPQVARPGEGGGPSDQGHPGGGRCCRACEWVHSKLSVHCADGLCCLGSC